MIPQPLAACNRIANRECQLRVKIDFSSCLCNLALEPRNRAAQTLDAGPERIISTGCSFAKSAPTMVPSPEEHNVSKCTARIYSQNARRLYLRFHFTTLSPFSLKFYFLCFYVNNPEKFFLSIIFEKKEKRLELLSVKINLSSKIQFDQSSHLIFLLFYIKNIRFLT